MLKKILIVLLVLIGVFLVLVSRQPSEFKVTRSITMAAPPAKVFTLVNNLNAWKDWSPWAKLDPNAKETHEGPGAGVGSVMRWSGNRQVGEGAMTITESRPNQLVRFKLEFLKPLPGTSESEFTFNPQGNQTQVNWTMTGHNSFPAKAISLFMDCDKIVGGQFEQGLSSLKAIAEKK